jgi:hypothetical protein
MNIKTILAGIVFFLFCCGTITACALALYDLIFLRTPPSPPYEGESVAQLCQLFDLASTDDFCIHVNEQHWYTLEATLKQRFPPGQATFQQIMNNIEISPADFSDPKKFGTSTAIAETFAGFAGGTCPDRLITADLYSCYVYLKEDVGPVEVVFERDTDIIIDIGVYHTGT